MTRGDDLLITRLVQIDHLLAIGVPGVDAAASPPFAAEANLRDALPPPGVAQRSPASFRVSGQVSWTGESCRDASTDKATGQLVTEATKT